MVEPLTLGLVGAAVGYVVKKTADVAAEWMLLRGQAGLVAAAGRLPAGYEIDVVGEDGVRWRISAAIVKRGNPGFDMTQRVVRLCVEDANEAVEWLRVNDQIQLWKLRARESLLALKGIPPATPPRPSPPWAPEAATNARPDWRFLVEPSTAALTVVAAFIINVYFVRRLGVVPEVLGSTLLAASLAILSVYARSRRVQSVARRRKDGLGAHRPERFGDPL